MSRAVLVATIFTSVLSFSSPSLAASDTELGHLGDKMLGAFRCSTYALMFDDQKEGERLFQIGLKVARDFVEGMKSRNDPKMNEITAYMQGVSTDFMVGRIYETETTKAYDEIVKYQNGLPREKRLDRSEATTEAKITYYESNCSLIQ